MPGVQAVLTAKDVPNAKTHGLFIKDWPVLVDTGEQIRYVGDAIAVVAADTSGASSCYQKNSRIRKFIKTHQSSERNRV